MGKGLFLHKSSSRIAFVCRRRNNFCSFFACLLTSQGLVLFSSGCSLLSNTVSPTGFPFVHLLIPTKLIFIAMTWFHAPHSHFILPSGHTHVDIPSSTSPSTYAKLNLSSSSHIEFEVLGGHPMNFFVLMPL